MNLKVSSLRLVYRTALIASIGITSSTAIAAPADTDASAPLSRVSKYPQLEQNLKTSLPETPIDDIQTTPLPGILAVISGRSIIYTDTTGKYVISGHMFDASSKRDLSIEVISARNRIDPRTLPLVDSFAEVRGNGKRQLYVFSDPDCPYCKRLEHELPKLTDVTIHVFLYPITALHPDANADAVAVWCSRDRAQAWQGKMMDDVKPSGAPCDNPVERNLALAEKLGINATPTIIFPDGKIIPGAMSAEHINSLLDQMPH